MLSWKLAVNLYPLSIVLLFAVGASAAELDWLSPYRYRLLLRVDPVRAQRSESPAAVELDPVSTFRKHSIDGRFDPQAIEVIAYDALGSPAVFDATRPGYERYLFPWRLEGHYGIDTVKLHFVLPSESYTSVAVYVDTVESGFGRPQRYPGLIGDGDFLRQRFQRREIGATHFDTFADLDRDGDLDLFRGGVEPFVYVFENISGGKTKEHRLLPRGPLTSGGAVLTLPRNQTSNRSWVVPHYHDLDGDGDLDLIASFMDGPYARRIAWFENTTVPSVGLITFVDRGLLRTAAGTPLAGGKQAGGWFPSLAFIDGRNEEGEATLDLVLGNNNRCYFYRCLGRDERRGWRWDEAVALRAGGAEIDLFNPCFSATDLDGDSHWDLLAAPQSGQVLFYKNRGGKETPPAFARGVILAYDDLYLQRSTHPRTTVADFTGDGLLDFVVDRAWELTDLRDPTRRDYGALFANIGTKTLPRWERRNARSGAPFTEEFQICDAIRQNVVRAVDWNADGKIDVLAGDCDGFVRYFANIGPGRTPLFAGEELLKAGGQVLSLAKRSGHARPDVCDWNNDGLPDLVVADGAGGAHVYVNEGSPREPRLAAGQRIAALTSTGERQRIQRGTRAHLLVCDWNSDGRKDLLFADQDNKGFWYFQNTGEDAKPRLAVARNLGLTPYVRPNFGSFVDWDGDGKKDLIACEFEHSIRLYKNTGTGKPGDAPRFADPRGTMLVKPFTIMMISGADAVDFNGDGDLDILTGQGHGGSGIRFYERDFIEDTQSETHPRVRVERLETREVKPSARGSRRSLLDVVRGYADAMLHHGRDVYGKSKSQLFLSALDRRALRPLEIRPTPPGGIRRGDRAGLPWQKLTGANPHNDENLLRVLYTLTDLTADPRYRSAADHEIRWFFENTQSPVTGLLPWGEHLSWDVMLDRPVSSGTELTHEFARPWVLWNATFRLAPESAKRFALGLWNHQIANHKTGAYDRHAPYDRHGPRDGKDFPRHGGFYVHTWAHAYKHTGDPQFLTAIRAILQRFERKRVNSRTGARQSTLGPLDVTAAAACVPDPLATRLRKFAAVEDELVLAELRQRYSKPGGGWSFAPTWQAGYAAGTTASWAMFALARWEQTQSDAFHDFLVAVADAYVDALPAEDVDVWPMTLGHVISTQVAAYRMTKRLVYLEAAGRASLVRRDPGAGGRARARPARPQEALP